MNDFDWAANVVLAGNTDTFGSLFSEDLKEAQVLYRRLSRILHPDIAPESRKVAAAELTTLLNVLWDNYQKKNSKSFVVATKLHNYTVNTKAHQSDELSNSYICEWDGDKHGLFKICRDPRNNSLLLNEFKVISALRKEIPSLYHVYLPSIVESFVQRNTKDNSDHRVNVIENLAGFYSLAELQQLFFDGLDGRDAAWVWRRLLAAISWIHAKGFIHGALVPENVYVHPTTHWVVLTNWSYAVESGKNLKAAPSKYLGWYEGRKHGSSSLDVDFIGRSMVTLMGSKAPVQMLAFARGCQSAKVDAAQLADLYDDLLYRLYGKRKYRPLIIPNQ